MHLQGVSILGRCRKVCYIFIVLRQCGRQPSKCVNQHCKFNILRLPGNAHVCIVCACVWITSNLFMYEIKELHCTQFDTWNSKRESRKFDGKGGRHAAGGPTCNSNSRSSAWKSLPASLLALIQLFKMLHATLCVCRKYFRKQGKALPPSPLILLKMQFVDSTCCIFL